LGKKKKSTSLGPLVIVIRAGEDTKEALLSYCAAAGEWYSASTEVAPERWEKILKSS
jgi:hypothetical protein